MSDRNYPARRQRAHPQTLPPDLPIRPDSRPRAAWKARLRNLASAAGYAGLLMTLIGTAALATYVWVLP